MIGVLIVAVCLLIMTGMTMFFQISNLNDDIKCKTKVLDSIKAENRELRTQMEENHTCHGTCVYRKLREMDVRSRIKS